MWANQKHLYMYGCQDEGNAPFCFQVKSCINWKKENRRKRVHPNAAFHENFTVLIVEKQ